MSDSTPGSTFIEWALREPGIKALNLIGSQVRPSRHIDAADTYSDWDFQIVVNRPAPYADDRWLKSARFPEHLAYAARPGRLGSSGKVSAMFSEGALDVVLIPESSLRLAKWMCTLGLTRHSARARSGLADLAVVLRSGYRMLKGEAAWGRFFRYVHSEIPLARIGDEDVVAIAEGYVCDFVSTRQKIARGEFLAAQRWLHGQLAESNFRLLHEFKQRKGEVSFPDARRIEVAASAQWAAAVTVRAVPERESLEAAIEKSAQTCRNLVAALVGNKWSWPQQLPLRLRGE